MNLERKCRWRILVLMGMFLILSVACTANEVMCMMTGGSWQLISTEKVPTNNGGEEFVSRYGCVGKSDDYVKLMESGPVIDSDGEDSVPAPPAESDPGAEPAQESVPQPEADTGEVPVPPAEGDQHPEFEPDPDPEPEYSDPSECNAVALNNYSLSSPITETSASNETTCEYTLTVTNIGPEDIVVFKHIDQVYYTKEDASRWEDYVRLSPGDFYLWKCYSEVRNDNGTFTFKIIDAIAVIYDTTGCMNTFKNNTNAKEEIRLNLPIECETP